MISTRPLFDYNKHIVVLEPSTFCSVCAARDHHDHSTEVLFLTIAKTAYSTLSSAYRNVDLMLEKAIKARIHEEAVDVIGNNHLSCSHDGSEEIQGCRGTR